MQPTCAGFGNGKLQKEIRRSGGRRLGGHGPKTGRRAIEDDEEEQQQQQDKSRRVKIPKEGKPMLKYWQRILETDKNDI
jgi:hypothetical protein